MGASPCPAGAPRSFAAKATGRGATSSTIRRVAERGFAPPFELEAGINHHLDKVVEATGDVAQQLFYLEAHA